MGSVLSFVTPALHSETRHFGGMLPGDFVMLGRQRCVVEASTRCNDRPRTRMSGAGLSLLDARLAPFIGDGGGRWSLIAPSITSNADPLVNGRSGIAQALCCGLDAVEPAFRSDDSASLKAAALFGN